MNTYTYGSLDPVRMHKLGSKQHLFSKGAYKGRAIALCSRARNEQPASCRCTPTQGTVLVRFLHWVGFQPADMIRKACTKLISFDKSGCVAPHSSLGKEVRTATLAGENLVGPAAG